MIEHLIFQFTHRQKHLDAGCRRVLDALVRMMNLFEIVTFIPLYRLDPPFRLRAQHNDEH